MQNRTVPFHRPSIGEEEIQAVSEVLRSGWLTTGPRAEQFESEFKDYVQAPYALAVNSGTAAMHLAMAALGIGPGDEVITSPMTFCSTVHSILQVGATPVLADIDAGGNIDPVSIEQRITSRTKALLPVHLGGLSCEMDSIWAIARRHSLFVIEDAAHAVGTQYKGFPIGAGNPTADYRSDAVCFSFYATKNLTTGEGGMVTTHDKTLADRMRLLCLHGIGKDAWNRYSEEGNWYYEVVERGFKYNLSDLQAALGIAQLRKQEQFIETRTRYAQMYNAVFRDIAGLEVPVDLPHARHCWHLYILRLNLELLDIGRNEFIKQLRREGVGCSVHFIPIPKHPVFRELAADPRNHCPKALGMYERIVSLPLYPAMTGEDVEHVVRAVAGIAGAQRPTPRTASGQS